ncbi:MAG TPA: hypothetical protein VLE02_01180 [Nitrosarchaeum sp.]|nr:hypothetical protein [Nitrosarchaeum sp.]
MNITLILENSVRFLNVEDALNLRLVSKKCTFDYFYAEKCDLKLLTTAFGVNQFKKFHMPLKVDTKDDMNILNGINCEILNNANVFVRKSFVVERCNAFHHISKINLSDTMIKDLSSLKNSHIVELDLTRAKVSDISFLEGCAKLTHLSLAFTLVTDISVLSSLTSIEVLNLEKTRCQDFSSIAHLKNLKVLCLSRTRFENETVLSELTNLTNLSIDGTRIKNILNLSQLTNLEQLNISKIRISDISPVAHIHKLDILIANFMGMYITNFRCGNSVRHLSACGARNEYLAQIAESENLEILDISGSDVTDISSLERCKKLHTLDLRLTPDCDLSSLRLCQTLRKIHLGRTFYIKN